MKISSTETLNESKLTIPLGRELSLILSPAGDFSKLMFSQVRVYLSNPKISKALIQALELELTSENVIAFPGIDSSLTLESLFESDKPSKYVLKSINSLQFNTKERLLTLETIIAEGETKILKGTLYNQIIDLNYTLMQEGKRYILNYKNHNLKLKLEAGEILKVLNT